jgi:hypothetical protein
MSIETRAIGFIGAAEGFKGRLLMAKGAALCCC